MIGHESRYSVTAGDDVAIVLICCACDEIIAEYDVASMWMLNDETDQHERTHE